MDAVLSRTSADAPNLQKCTHLEPGAIAYTPVAKEPEAAHTGVTLHELRPLFFFLPCEQANGSQSQLMFGYTKVT